MRRAASVQVLAKVVQVLPARLRRRVDALRAMTVRAGWEVPGTGVDPSVLTELALACRDDERVRFGYTSAEGRHSEREIEPHRLVSLGRRWYLVGYDLTRHDWRRFRLDRLTEAHRTGARFRPRELPATDAAAFVRAGIENLPPTYAVEALIDAPAAKVRERIGQWTTVTDVDGPRCRVRMTTDSLDRPIMALGVAGADFRVLAPLELLDRVHDWGARFGRAGTARAGLPETRT